MKAVFLLFDSLNRHFLPAYGNTESIMPNLSRLQKRSAVFDGHWAGSMPCMPARRDIFTGRLEFLERRWGPLEPFDVDLVSLLNRHGVHTHMITDHYHYFESSGEHYCQRFTTWDFIRGQEWDKWAGKVEKRTTVYPGFTDYEPVMEERRRQGHPDMYGAYCSQYELNYRRHLKEGFPCDHVFDSACGWLDENHDADHWFLMVEAFDPHEPFESPDAFKKRFHETYDGPEFTWSSYRHTEEPPEAVERLRRNYLANLSYADHCLGRLLDKLDQYDLWKDTMVVLTTDHGHLLGEHDFTGKNFMPMYNEIAHIPLLIHMPGGKHAGKRYSPLTQNIDMFPTFLEYFHVEHEGKIHGSSLIPLMEGEVDTLWQYALYGVFGLNVNITDGAYTYMRAKNNPDNAPLYLYTATPSVYSKRLGTGLGDEELFKTIETGRFLPYTNHPVFKVPCHGLHKKGRFQFPQHKYNTGNRLFDLKNDYGQKENLAGSEMEIEYCNALKRELKRYEAPGEQFQRLGL